MQDRTDRLLGVLIFLAYLCGVVYLSYTGNTELAFIFILLYYVQNMWGDIKDIQRKLDKLNR